MRSASSRVAEASTLVPLPEVLEQDGAELDESKGSLTPGDDGVHAGTVAVVGTDATVSVTVEGGGVATVSTISLAGDQINKGRFLGLLHGSLSLVGQGRTGVLHGGSGRGDPDRSTPQGFCQSIGSELPHAKGRNGKNRSRFRPGRASPGRPASASRTLVSASAGVGRELPRGRLACQEVEAQCRQLVGRCIKPPGRIAFDDAGRRG